MYARVVSAHAKLDKLDQVIEIFRSMEVTWQQQKGFQSANLLVQRKTGKILSISTWATQADLEATEASGWYQEQLAKFAATWMAPPARDICEVAAHVDAARALGT